MESQTMSMYDRDWTREDARQRAALPEPRIESDIETNDRRQASIAESHALERRWAELHEEVLQLNQEWQQLLSIISSRVETTRNGQSLNWSDGAAAFYDLAQEAVQTCHQYALALQRVLDAMTEG
jgi:hypothetical protein